MFCKVVSKAREHFQYDMILGTDYADLASLKTSFDYFIKV